MNLSSPALLRIALYQGALGTGIDAGLALGIPEGHFRQAEGLRLRAVQSSGAWVF